MPGSWKASDFPLLTVEACEVTIPATRRYNCVAWAAGEDFRWWWPDPMGVRYWPSGARREASLAGFLEAFATLNYARCETGELEAGFEKVAVFGQRGLDGALSVTHAARQLASGEWTSKLGSLEDVRHVTAEAIAGPLYGAVVLVMKRLRA